jgi:hypothetical protein
MVDIIDRQLTRIVGSEADLVEFGIARWPRAACSRSTMRHPRPGT